MINFVPSILNKCSFPNQLNESKKGTIRVILAYNDHPSHCIYSYWNIHD